MSLLEARSLAKSYRGRRVVDDVSFRVEPGEIVGLLGPNGAGKTTSFHMVLGMVRPDEGAVLFRDENVTRMAIYRRARLGIAYLPQEPSIFRKMTVEGNILAILETLKPLAQGAPPHGSRRCSPSWTSAPAAPPAPTRSRAANAGASRSRGRSSSSRRSSSSTNRSPAWTRSPSRTSRASCAGCATNAACRSC